MTTYVRRVTRPKKSIAVRLESLDIELTERCNNNCMHCSINLPASDADARSREMGTDQVEQVLSEAAELGCLEVRLTGGEPMLRSDFEDLYVFARRLGLRVLIFTNACLITARLADVFERIPPLVPIEVTVYGLHRDSYEAVTRTPGSFAQFRAGVDLLLDRRIPFVVKSALLPPNRHEVDELESWAATIPWMTKPPTYSMRFDLRARRDDPGRNHLIAALRASPQDCLGVLSREPVRYRQGMTEFAKRFMGPPGASLFSCGAGHGPCVDAYGCAQPCMGLRSPEFAVDVSRASILDAMQAFASLGDMRATNPDYLHRCARCMLHGLCEQCPARSFTEHGELDTPVEYLCQVAHAQARHMGWLSESEHGWDVPDWRGRLDLEKTRKIAVPAPPES